MTVTVAVPSKVPFAAVSVVVPAARAVKYPVSFTVPIVSSLLDHAMAISLIGRLFWSRAAAVNCIEVSIPTSALAGVTLIEVSTGGMPATV